jgi:hypothetical protein
MERQTATIDATRSGEVISDVPPVEQQIEDVFRHPNLAALSFKLAKDDSDTQAGQEKGGALYNLQARKVEDLRNKREALLKELHVSEIEKTLDKPALYIQEAISAFAEKCVQRAIVTNHGNQENARFATVRHSQRPDGADRITKDLDMSIQFERDSEGMFQPESYSVGVEFKNALNTEPIGYVFHASGEELTIQQRYWSKGEWQYKDVDDEVEQLVLCQALATEMLWAERKFTHEDNEAAKDLVKKDTLVDNY